MISSISQELFQNGVEPLTVTATGVVLIAINFAVIGISALSVALVGMKLLGEFSPAPISGSGEDGPANRPFISLDDESHDGVKATRRQAGKVSRRRPRYRSSPAVPSHAINISISSSPDPARSLVSTVERTPATYDPPVTEHKAQPKEIRPQAIKQRRIKKDNSIQPASLCGHDVERQRAEVRSCEEKLEAASTVASDFQPASILQTLGFERVMEKRTDSKVSSIADRNKSSSIGQQLVEMNRKVRQGG